VSPSDLLRYDLLNLFKILGPPSATNPYYFNGDFVDRGSFSVECALLLLAFKVAEPRCMHLARGNHECRNMNMMYGFQEEVHTKYNSQTMELFTDAFNMLPLGCVIGGQVFCVHGGLFSRDGVSIAELQALDRKREPPDSGLMSELLWSDPSPFPGRQPSKRGVGVAFGPDVNARFLTLT